MGKQYPQSVESRLLCQIRELAELIQAKSYVQSYPTMAQFPAQGVVGTLYVDESTGNIYVWNGTSYNLLSTGITVMNALTASAQFLVTGDGGSDFNIVSSGTTHTFNIPTASSTKRGLLSSIDWTTFNNKQDTITLTTIGDSGAPTFVSNTLNVPTYTLAGLGGEPAITPGTTLQYWRGDKSWQTLNTTVVPEGTNLYYTDARSRSSISLTTTGTSGAATYSSSTGVLNIPQYQTALTNPVTGTGTTNYLPKWTSSSAIGNSLIQDNGLNVGVNTAPTTTKFTVSETANSWAAAFIAPSSNELQLSGNITGNNNGPTIRAVTSGGAAYTSLTLDGSYIDLKISGTSQQRIFTTGNVSIGSTTDAGVKLFVNGTLRATDSAYFATTSGNVLVGATTPAISSGAKYLYLEVGVAGLGPELILHNTVANDTAEMAVSFTGVRSGAAIASQIKSNRRGLLTFHTQDLPTATPTTPPARMAITNLGNVGIGTTTPVRNLHVSNSYSAPTLLDANVFGVISNNSSAANFAGVSILGGISGGSFLHFGDTDNGGIGQIGYFHSTDHMDFRTSSNERMRIFSNGNIGIATTTDAGYRVDVNGILRAFRNTAGASTIVSQSQSGNVALFQVTNPDGTWNLETGRVTGAFTIFQSGATTRLLISDTGNVGIGTTTPQQKFVVSNAGAEGIEFVPGASSNSNQILSYNRSTSAYSDLVTRAATYNVQIGTTGALYINASGAVGIGTTSPTARLDVLDGTIRSRTTAGNISDLAGGTITLTNSGGGIIDNTANTLFLQSASDIVFRGTSPSFVERVRFTSSGNVGIGTSSPQDFIHMMPVTSPSYMRFGFAPAFANIYGRIGHNGNSGGFEILSQYDGANVGSGVIRFINGLSGSTTEKMRISHDGNVGIGTTSPTSKLHVIGTGASTNSINVGLIVDMEATAAEQVGAGTAILFRGKSGGGNIANYDQAQIATNNTGTNNTHGLSFFIKPNAASPLTEAFTISGNANVGFGTNTPSYPIDSIGTASTAANNTATGSSTRFRNIYTRSRANSAGISGDVYADQLFHVSGGAAFEIYNADNLPLVLGTNALERMRIHANGNIAIGSTTDSGKKLAVTGDIKVFSGVFAVNDTGTGDGLTIFHSGSNTMNIQQNNNAVLNITTSGASGDIVFNPNSSGAMRITGSGGVRIIPRATAPTPAAGTLYYDSTTNKLKLYDGTSWVDLN